MFPLMMIALLVAAVPQSALIKDPSRSARVALPALPASSNILSSAVSNISQNRAILMVGDRIKIELFQKNPVTEPQGLASAVAKGATSWSFRSEVSGIFTIQEDGSVVLPILGPFAAVNRSVSELGVDIVSSYRATFSTEANAAVTIAERPPVYVLGAVKSPGSFRYEPGMTAMHAIALSGGMERGPTDQWSIIELAREGAKAASAAQILKIAAADLAVLRAERDGSEIAAPPELNALLGPEAAKGVVGHAFEKRKARLDAFEKQRNTLQFGLEVAMKNLTLDGERLAVLTKGASARNQRVDILQGFVTKGMSSQALLNQAQAESSDHDDRALSVRSHLGEAEYKVSLARQELAKFDLDRLIEREAAIATLEKDLVDAQATLNVFDTIQVRLSPKIDQSSRASAQVIDIVRKHPTPFVLTSADPTVVLSPGDLVRVHSDPGKGAN